MCSIGVEVINNVGIIKEQYIPVSTPKIGYRVYKLKLPIPRQQGCSDRSCKACDKDNKFRITGLYNQSVFDELTATELQKDQYATCSRQLSEHSSPDLRCACGFYVYTNKKYARLEQETEIRSILTRVEYFGRVIFHHFGLRAQHIKVIGLYKTSPTYRRLANKRQFEIPDDKACATGLGVKLLPV